MKRILIGLMVLSFNILSSQNINCLDIEFYKSYDDILEIKDISYDFNEIHSVKKKDSIQIIVLGNKAVSFPEMSRRQRSNIEKGFAVIMINNTPSDFQLYTLDGEIIIVRQVFYEGEWKNLKSYRDERLRFCISGFSKNRTLKSNNSLNFVAPCLNGNIEAKFRFLSIYFGDGESFIVYSNEFDGFISEDLIQK